MTASAKVKLVAFGTVGMAVFNAVLLLLITGGDKLPVRVFRIALACVFAFFLIRGSSWARWLVGIFAVLGVILGVIAWINLDDLGASRISLLGIWMVTLVCFNVWVAWMVFLDKDVTAFFEGGW